MEINYNGTYITNAAGVELEKAELDTYFGGRADTLYLEFADPDGLWKIWDALPGDTVRLTEGHLDSGAMEVDEVKHEDGMCCITAASVVDWGGSQGKAWAAVSFGTLARDVLGGMGYQAEFYGVDTSVVYGAVTQNDEESDLAFLARRCALEGCALMFRDGKGIIAGVDAVENAEGGSMRLEAPESAYRAWGRQRYGSCKVTDGETEATVTENESLPGFVYRAKERLTSIGEARRFAKNLLRQKNRRAEAGVMYNGSLLGEMAAGSKFTADCGPYRNRLAIANHIRHDILKEKTKIWFYVLPEVKNG